MLAQGNDALWLTEKLKNKICTYPAGGYRKKVAMKYDLDLTSEYICHGSLTDL